MLDDCVRVCNGVLREVVDGGCRDSIGGANALHFRADEDDSATMNTNRIRLQHCRSPLNWCLLITILRCRI